MENVKELNKKELAQLLGKSYNTVTKWTEEKIQQELLKNCYEIINVEKKGRQIIYTLEYKEKDVGDNITLWLISEYNLKKQEEFKEYLKVRILITEGKVKPMGAKKVAEGTNVNVNTVKSWDKMLEKIELLSKDGYFYIKATGFKETYKEEVVSEEEYRAWWGQHKVMDRALKIIEDSPTLKQKEKNYFRENLRMGCDVFYYRIRKVVLNKEHPFYNALKRNLGFEE